MWRKGDLLYTAGGNVNWCSCCMEVSQKTKNTATIWPNNYTPGYISGKKPKKIPYITKFTAALLKNGKIWKQSRCPATEEWIKKMWYLHLVYTHIHTMEYYSATKKNENFHLQQHGWTWRALCWKTNTIWYHICGI